MNVKQIVQTRMSDASVLGH